ncbi:hypothetical protein [Methylococcus sp. EFPC2]|uniref:hypothetical protein n=1 Tax=Methylococcus sp. EFPC2 TaxID=2812648 RepID=UPI001967DC12|nr:hypothetical protein [Methylococcus sp. EFPC2]QSA96750.1 hypothetical protein JWZ97_16315 [Methylococcus sp. EFPC2]
MTLEERLTAIKAEHLAALEESDAFRRLAESRRSATAGQPGDNGEVFVLRERADAASERACELAEQIEEIQAHLDETAAEGRAQLLSQLHTVRERLRGLGAGGGSQGNVLQREAQEQALQRQLQSLRTELLGEKGESLAVEYLAAARQLLRTATELKAFADFAALFGVRLGLHVEDLRIPPPQGDRAGFHVCRPEDLRVDAVAVQSAKAAITEKWGDLLSD